MRNWRTWVSASLAAIWVVVGAHCLLEVLPGLDFLSCCQHSQAEKCSAHDVSDCDGDGCSAIESGHYQLEKPLSVPVPILMPLTAWLQSESESLQTLARALPVSLSTSPPDLVRVWQFSLRTALSPRAPSLVS
jgi:hypothetical protein